MESNFGRVGKHKFCKIDVLSSIYFIFIVMKKNRHIKQPKEHDQ